MKTGFKTNEEYDKVNAVVSLAFRVVPVGDGLYASQILMLRGDTVAEKRTGIGTTLGHAIGGADEMLDGWAFSEIETKPEDFFRDIMV